jgi:co-chaperonin GroES (HSP10)
VSELTRLRPSNRHLLVLPHFKENKTNSGVVLPEDYQPEENVYIEATVLDVAEDCNEQFNFLKFGRIELEKKVVLDRRMLQEIKLQDKVHYLVLENYIMGVYRRFDEG